MISAVDLLKGIAVGASMKVITVEGANGGLHTNYEGKAEAAVKVLTEDGYDFVYVHVEAPDEMGHQGSVEKKVKAIENLDERVIRPIVQGMGDAGEDYRLWYFRIIRHQSVSVHIPRTMFRICYMTAEKKNIIPIITMKKRSSRDWNFKRGRS